MNDWDLDADWDWELGEPDEDDLFSWADQLAECFYLSTEEHVPLVVEDEGLGFVDAEDWEPLVAQLSTLVDLDVVLELAANLQRLLPPPGLPTELLENPLGWLERALSSSLPPEPSGRKVGSRRLVQVARAVIHLAQELPDTARAAVHAWAEVQRSLLRRAAVEDDEALRANLPPAVTGFSMMIAMSLIVWPRRANGLDLPPGFARPDMYPELMQRWESLPDGLADESEEAGEAEALFAQGRLAHLLAQLDTPVDVEGGSELEAARAYSRLSRAILWVHNSCRHCPQRAGVTCRAVSGDPQQPVPLLDVAGRIANTGRIEGCILQQAGT